MHSDRKSLYPQGFGSVKFSIGKDSHSAKSFFSDKEKRKKVLAGAGIFVLVIFGFWFTKNVLQDMPDITKVKNMVFSEATTIEDRNGKPLYKLYEENREYVEYSGISQNMINAIVAVEDQRYREHNGLDPMGILRAGLSSLVGGKQQGASTIPQQLMTNIFNLKAGGFSSSLDKAAYKIKQIILSRRLNSFLQSDIKKSNKDLSSEQIKKEMKKKTMELYLNYVFLGNNSYGVQAASKTYFSKDAKDLDVLESAALASIPKGPSVYEPYKNKSRLMGEFSIKSSDGSKKALSSGMLTQVIATMQASLANTEIKKENNDFVKTLQRVGTFSLTAGSGESVIVSYTAGRKDSALARMYEDGYITQNEAKQAFLEGINYTFRKNKVDMVAPHFVQWIIEELEKKYDKDTLFKGGIVVKTTLDLDIQKMAEDALIGNMSVLQENGANNSAMLYVDSKNGDVLAYAGSLNYFDEKIQGQNDMVRRPRQSGSSIKPLIYALGFEKLPLTIDTPIFDIPFQIGKDKPNNADDKFSGLLPLRLALAQSRNITSAKLITALGGEEVAKPFLRSLGLSGVQTNVEYGYTLALGAAEVTMLDLTNAYMHLSQNKPAQIDPILEIRSRDGSLIYQKQVVQQPEVIKSGISYLLWKILSEPGNRLPGWVGKFNIPGLSLALKTGTSNAKTDKGNRPRDGWMATYNASKVALFRAGNADATPMNRNAYGGTIHATPMKSFFTKLLKNNYITNDIIKPVDVGTAQISKISGKLANDKTPADLVVDTMYYLRGVPLGSDEGAEVFDYDSSCNGAASQLTPSDELKKGYLITPSTFMPSRMDIGEITSRWKNASSITGVLPVGGLLSGNVFYNYNNIFVEKPANPCASREMKEDPTIQISTIKPEAGTTISAKFPLWYSVEGSRPITSVVVFADGEQIAQFPYKGGKKAVSEIKSITSQLKDGEHTLQIVAIDNEGFSNKKDFAITVVASDTQAPTVLENKTTIKQGEDGKYQVTLILDDDRSFITKGKVSINETTLSSFEGNVASFSLDSLAPVLVIAQDAYGNKLEKTITLQQ